METLKSFVRFLVFAVVVYMMTLAMCQKKTGCIEEDDIVMGGIAAILITAFVYAASWAFS